MPFDFVKYDAKCANLDGDALQLEWEHYTRLIAGAATSTTVSGAAIPFTFGVSSIGVGLAAPAIHNARKKRDIIERHLQRLGRSHHTRKRDVITAGAISGTVGLVTLGLAPVGADAICNSAAERGIAYIAENELAVKLGTHLALDTAAVVAEEYHMNSKKEQEAWKTSSQNLQAGGILPCLNSGLQIPANTSGQVTGFNATYYGTPFQSTSMVGEKLPLEQQTSVEPAAVYFPPPPSQAKYKSNGSHYGRHSISTLSLDAQTLIDTPSQPRLDDRFMWATTTAISAPAIGGQSYAVQLREQSIEFPDKSTSEVDCRALSKTPETIPSMVGNMFQQTYITPPASTLVRPQDTYIQQYQTQEHQSRAGFTAILDGTSTHARNQQAQYCYSTSPLPLVSPSIPTAPLPPAYIPTAAISPSHQSTWCPSYDPSNYLETRQQITHGPAEIVPSHYGAGSQVHHLKGPLVDLYEIKSPTTTTSWMGRPISTSANTTTTYVAPDSQEYHSRPSTGPVVQQDLYFPPPPTAY